MIVAIGLGTLCGGVIFLLVLHLVRPRPAPLVELARFDAAHTHASSAPQSISIEPGSSPAADLPAAAGAWVARQLTLRGVTNTSLRQDLALTGRTYEQVMTWKVLFAAGGLLLSLLLLVVVPAAVGAVLPAGAALIVAVLLAAALFFLPDLDARGEATRRRAEFRLRLAALQGTTGRLLPKLTTNAGAPLRSGGPSLARGGRFAVGQHGFTTNRPASGTSVATASKLAGPDRGLVHRGHLWSKDPVRCGLG